jgi:hypothetical protein
MSSAFCHVSHGIAGFTGAPAPALVTRPAASRDGTGHQHGHEQRAQTARPLLRLVIWTLAPIISASRFALRATGVA